MALVSDLVNTPGSPEWWVKRLHKRLVARQPEIDFFEAYYTGDHPLPWLAPQARDEFRRILAMTRTNYMGLVIDAMVERLQVEGFRFGADSEADTDTWDIYQANNLDTDTDMAWLEAAITKQSYFYVAPNDKDQSRPHVWVEHPSQMIVEYKPGTNRRVRGAGLKVWGDDWTNEIHSVLQLDDGMIYKFKGERPEVGQDIRWAEREVTGEQPNGHRTNPLKEVTMVEVLNNPRLLAGGVSELYDLTDIQDRVNKTVADRLITQDYGAFPQKWISGWPDEDMDGNPNTLDIGRNRAVTTDVKETKFGQWDTAPLDPYSMAKREDVKDIASRSRTPAQYLLGEMSNVNGETLKASESGLVSKVRHRQRPFEESLEEAMRIARKAAGLPASSGARMETIWHDPQYRTQGELVDAVVKKLQAKIASLRQAREDVGYTPQQIAKLEQDDLDAGVDPVAAAILKNVGNGFGGGQPGQQPVIGGVGGNGAAGQPRVGE